MMIQSFYGEDFFTNWRIWLTFMNKSMQGPQISTLTQNDKS